MTTNHTIDDVTCLGCGCACDDIRVVVQSSRIADAQNACALGRQWFGDGQVPSVVRVDGRDASIDDAIAASAARLSASTRPLVYLAPAISCETQREGVAVADLLGARLDSVTSVTALPFVLAAQERGFASATLGEIRNRADLIVFWAIDVEHRYPRFTTRYAPEPVGRHVPDGRRGRRVIAVDVGGAQSTISDVDHRVTIAPADEPGTLTALAALVREPPSILSLPATSDRGASLAVAGELAELMQSARYIALVIDAEPDDRSDRSTRRFDMLLALSQALNHRTRCAIVALRGNGNRSGADSTLTSQTGFPLGIDLSRGYPRYDPHLVLAGELAARTDIALVIGDATLLPVRLVESLSAIPTIVIGPRASAVSLGPMTIAIDTGVSGIHSAGIAYRTDDVPLRLRAPLSTGRSAAEVVAAMARQIASARPRSVSAREIAAR